MGGGSDAAAGAEGQGFDWSQLGGPISKGFQTFGNQYAQAQQDNQNYMKGTPSLYQTPGDYQPAPVSFNTVPGQQGGGDLLAVLQRILGGLS